MAIKFTEIKFYKYLYLRLIRQRGTAYNLAFSVAIGVFFGFIVPLFQMFLAILFAWIFKANKLVAAACTWVSNPLTYAFIFPINIYIGGFFIKSDFDAEKLKEFSLSTIFTDFSKVFYFFISDGMLMFMIGGAILGAVSSVLSYAAVFFIIRKHREEKKVRFFKRRKAIKEKTGISG